MSTPARTLLFGLLLAACGSEQAETDEDTRAPSRETRDDPGAGDTGEDESGTDLDDADPDTVETSEDADTTTELPGCTPGAFVRCATERSAIQCDAAGERTETVTCPAEAPFCLDGTGCSPSACTPGVTRTCLDATTVGVCNAAGDGYDVAESCGAQVCVDPGECSDACLENEKNPSNLGCEYWAADLPQDRGDTAGGDGRGGAEAQTWAVVVSNPNPQPVAVSVFAASDLSTAIRDVTVEPGGLSIIEMPRDDLFATSITNNAFRIRSNRPVAAHQFNPLDNVAVQSNDASLLLPANALSGSYRLLSWKTRVSWYASATVIAVSEGTTRVTVVSPDEIVSPEDNERSEEGTMDGWDDREPRTFSLSQGQVLNLSTRFLTDLTGLSVEADQPVAVFSSAAGVYVPTTDGTSDHIEHQMLPVEAWRSRYAGVPFVRRGTVDDYFRVIAAEDGTEVVSTIPINGGPWSSGRTTLAAGAWAEFRAHEAFELAATGPIQVAHYMAGSQAEGVPQTCSGSTGQVGLGDPALTVLVPAEQWRSDYTVLVPNGYAEDHLSLVGPAGTAVTLTGNDGTRSTVTLDTAIGTTGLAWGRYAIPRAAGGGTTLANVWTLTAPVPFGVEVYGWSCAVSYAYPGGLNLEGVSEE